MINVVEFSYEIDQRLNKLSTNDHQAISVEDKVIAMNNAQDKMVLLKIGPNNPSKLGLDGFKKRYQDLQFLCENPEDHPLTLKLSDKHLNKYLTKIVDLKPKFMFYLDSYMIADKGNCKNNIVYANGDLIKHTDITLLLQNNNYKPSFEYQETIVDISSDELHYYTDGTFTPSLVYVSYIRYPKRVDIEGYIKFDGSASKTIHFELEDYLKDELLDLVVKDLAMFTENTPAVQNTMERLQGKE